MRNEQQDRDEAGPDEPGDLATWRRPARPRRSASHSPTRRSPGRTRPRCSRRPTPIISWSGSTSSPRRAAKLEDVAMVSVSDTSVMPTAAGQRAHRGPEKFVHGKRRASGCPAGSVPTVATPSARQIEHRRHDRRSDDGDQHGGNHSGDPGEQEQHAEDRQRRSRASRSGSRRGCSKNRTDLLEEPVGVDGEPEQLRELADDDRDGRGRSGSRPGPRSTAGRRRTRAWPRPRPISIRPTSSANIPARAMAVEGSSTGEQRCDRRRGSAATPRSRGRAPAPSTGRGSA